MNAIDLSGGLEPALDGPRLQPDNEPGYGENHAFWLFDEGGEFALLCGHIQPIPDRWDVRRESGAVALGAERLLVFQGEGRRTAAWTPAGNALSFVCADPFRQWHGEFYGTTRDTTRLATSRAPIIDGPRAFVELEFDATMAVPPWVQGAVSAQGLHGAARSFVGGFRYEQLFRGEARLTVDGTQTQYAVTGLRTHRAGPRTTADMPGHSWSTVVLPSGRAFGLMRFPNEDGSVGFSEAWIYQDGEMLPAEVVSSPWLTTVDVSTETFTIELESALGRSTIHGATGPTVFHTVHFDGGWLRLGVHPDANLVIGQSMARYSWDDEQANGLLERSARVSALEDRDA